MLTVLCYVDMFNLLIFNLLILNILFYLYDIDTNKFLVR